MRHSVDFYNNAPYAQMMPGYGNVPYSSDQVSNFYPPYPANDGMHNFFLENGIEFPTHN